MKKNISVLILIFLAAGLNAQSVWTGNAAVGGSADFPGSSEVFRANSNSFPAGTILQVTNPRGGAVVNVVVNDRLESPGVFILLERTAALAIGLPTDHVVPVRVSPVTLNSPEEPELITVEDGELTADTDYNLMPALEDDLADTGIAVIPGESEAEETDIPVSETIYTYDLTDSPVDEIVDENSESRIYFLLPSDLRPPEAGSAEPLVSVTIDTPKEMIYPVEQMQLVSPGDSRRYIQIGAYKSRTILEDTARNLKQGAPGYPLSYAEDSGSNGTIYKLLIGPLMPAETGVVLKAARSTVFPDAFPYRP